MKNNPTGLEAETLSLKNADETALIEILEQMEQKHGFIPNEISDEITRLLEVKFERLRRIQGKLDSTTRQEIKHHVDHWRNEEGNLIMILHAIQNQHGYVPREAAMELSRELDVKLARIYEVITFYHYFKLQPPGEHEVTVCNGTACYLKGANTLIDALRIQLGISEGQTTPDRQVHFDTVRCIGCCGMAPSVVIDGKTCGHVKSSDIAGHLAKIRAHQETAA